MIYSQVILSKTNEAIPLLYNGKPVHSKYNPKNDRMDIPSDFSDCIIAGGIAAGFHIENLIKSNNPTLIIAVENDNDSLEFCRQFETVKNLECKTNVVFCTVENLEKTIINYYLPAIHGNIRLDFHRVWLQENKEESYKISEIVKKALESVSADYSVQSHFGKIWQRNALINLKNLDRKKINFPIPEYDNFKTAAIIAAGPSLDKSIMILKENRNSFCILSTDTAYGALIKNGLIPDFVVSIDCQHISTEHFMFKHYNPLTEKFVFDICSNHETISMLNKKGAEIIFIKNNHPLVNLALENSNVEKLESGSGTVTIAACDFAKKMGFKKIRLFGADFSYSSGKPYSKGTYLEEKFYSTGTRLESAEKLYTKLMFRTPLYPKKTDSENLKTPVTNSVLESYEKTMFEWAEKNGYIRTNDTFILKKCESLEKEKTSPLQFDFNNFINRLLKITKQENKTKEQDIYPLLPYLAWLRKNYPENTFLENLKLEYKCIKHYNESL